MIKNFLFFLAVLGLLLIGYFVFNGRAVKTMPKTQKKEETKLPFKLVDKNKKYQAVMETTEGKMTIELYSDETPIAVSNFISLSKKGFYNDTIFHRVIYDFMVQGGDPKGNGTGGPGYRFEDEPVLRDYTKGTIAMANSGPDTNGSQFFIMHKDYPLPKDYVIFGKVIDGLDVVDRLASTPVEFNPGTGENSKPVNPERVVKVTIKEL